MYTSSALAKRYGFERYLENPAELNDLIFNLMLLQETIQLEKARKKKREVPETESIQVKRTVYGKFIAGCSGDGKYRYAVETALRASTEVLSVFQRNKFVKVLTSMGVPEDKIREFCESVTIDDDTHCIDGE
ncbi:MAG: hypothetical protein A2010_04975 [Nitrospirae bacterium GWD2_57_9]|nr:MAG: hypothetical protein A2010_04975 [Nitrospirae bacterium GWD2_57_9]OGW49594.1 MAG: hypothetical protein A2078_11845 [Nitrospirae bacterium GWC2_57_9]